MTFEAGQGISVVLTSMTPFTEYIVRKMVVTKVSFFKLSPLTLIEEIFVHRLQRKTCHLLTLPNFTLLPGLIMEYLTTVLSC